MKPPIGKSLRASLGRSNFLLKPKKRGREKLTFSHEKVTFIISWRCYRGVSPFPRPPLLRLGAGRALLDDRPRWLSARALLPPWFTPLNAPSRSPPPRFCRADAPPGPARLWDGDAPAAPARSCRDDAPPAPARLCEGAAAAPPAPAEGVKHMIHDRFNRVRSFHRSSMAAGDY
jgi:hypothetical protein